MLLIGSSGVIARLFGEPSLTGIALALSVTFVMAALIDPAYALMRRAMQFRRIAMIDISANVVGSIVSVAMAFTGWGYWSLVAKPIVTAGLTAIGVWMSCGWVPGRPRFTPDAKELVGFGVGVTGFTMTDYLAKSADRLAIGYFQGQARSAISRMRSRSTAMSSHILTEPLHNIAASSLSKLRTDVEALKRAWATALSTLTFFSAPAFAVLAVIRQDFVVLLLGQKWAPAGPLLCIFAVRGIAYSVERTMGWLHVAAGRSDRWMRWGVYSAFVQLMALLVGLPFGVTGIALAYASAAFALCVPALVYSGEPFGIRSRDVLKVVGPQIVGGVIAVFAGFLVQLEFLADYSHLMRMFVSGMVCLATYLAVVAGVFRVTGPLRLVFSVLRDLRLVRMPAGFRS